MSSAGTDLFVDIVVNNYNYGSFLGHALESTRRQTHENVKVILVDDGSTDGSRALIREQESDLSVILKENGGQASALNAGIERCKGDIVMFLDADDVLRPEAAARVAAAFAADRAVAKVQFRMDVIDAGGRPTGGTKPLAHLPMPNGDLRQAELAFPFDLAWLPTSGNAFRVDAVRRLFPVPEETYRIGADWYLVHLATLLGSVVSLEEIGASYRVHGGNSYEPQSPRVDLDHIRETIGFVAVTSPPLLSLATELGLPHPERILSLADLANRMISVKLEPERHPLPDRAAGLMIDSVRAARRRFNVSTPMKLAFVAWFAAMALSPRFLARRLATPFLFSSRRRSSFNRILGRWQSSDDHRNAAVAP